MPAKNATKPAPPPSAVAKDAHWASSLERLRNRQRPTTVLTICDDPDVKERLAYARQLERRAQVHVKEHPDDAQGAELLEQAEAELAKAQAAFDEVGIVLRFQALPRAAFEALKSDHPPTEEQADEGQPVNPETLGPELIAAASLDGITIDDAKQFLAEWAEGEAVQLFHAAWDVQQQSRMDLGKG